MNLRTLKRILIAIIGGTVLLIGVVMIALPGPAILIIPLGLGILATEFLWARKLLDKFKQTILRKKAKPEEKTPA